MVTLAKCSGAKIVLLHIIEENAPQTIHGEPHLTRVEEAEAYLDTLASRSLGQLAIEHHVHGTEENNVAQSIAAHVEELGADVVALSTHGSSGPRRVVFGSIAQQVLRE